MLETRNAIAILLVSTRVTLLKPSLEINFRKFNVEKSGFSIESNQIKIVKARHP